MHQHSLIRALSSIALLSLSVLPAACKSTEGNDQAASTADRVVQVGGAAGQTQLRLDNTLSALEKIVATAKQDPKPAFTTFVKEYESFGSELDNLTKQRATLSSDAASWFAEFEKQNDMIQDPKMKSAGAKRLSEFKEEVADMSKQVDEVMAGAVAERGHLGDLRKFLGNDLTAKGIDAASDSISSCTKDGRKVAAGLGELSKSSESLANNLRAAREKQAQ